MSIQAYVEQKYKEHTDEFASCPEFQKIESGAASHEEYDAFIANVFRTHQNSPNFLAFLLALTAPVAFDRVKHNLLEELGIEEEDGESHPDLLLALLEGAGLTDRMDELHGMAKETMKALIVEPMFYESLREYGLAAREPAELEAARQRGGRRLRSQVIPPEEGLAALRRARHRRSAAPSCCANVRARLSRSVCADLRSQAPLLR